MADKIQLTIESFVPELDALVKKGIFAKKDAKKIIKKRRYHEYQFEKKDVTPIEYFKAIRYEKIINKRFLAKKKELKIKHTDYYDFHCNTFYLIVIVIRRIIVLFKKCLQKFFKDEKIWLEFFNFLIKNNSLKILNKEIGVALVKHPTNITFWKIAAYNELENNFNSITARQLMQKCIRLNSSNLDAYLEYFVFEIVFANKYLERKTIMLSSTDLEKLKIINDVTDENSLKEIDNKVDDKDDIINLKIAELIWVDTLNKFKTMSNKDKTITITQISLLFLSKLEYYGNKTNSVPLEHKIIQSLLYDNPNDISVRLSIIANKLEKYSNETEYSFHLISEYTTLIDNTPQEQLPHLCLLLIQYIISKDNKDSFLYSVFKVIHSKINLSDLFCNYDKGQYNLQLIEMLTFPNVIANIKEVLIKENRTLNDIIYAIYINIITNSQEEYIESIFRILTNLYNENFDYSVILSVQLSNQSPSFIMRYIKQVIALIPQIVIYDPDLRITLDYFTKLNNQLNSMKLRLESQCYKCLYEEILRVIMNKIIEAKEITDEYKAVIDYIKEQMSQKLINFDYIKRNIIQALTHEQKKLIETL